MSTTAHCPTDIPVPASRTEDPAILEDPSILENPSIQAAPSASDGSSKLLKGLFIGFAATVTVGLALAIWYLGVRIVAAGEVGHKNAPVAATKPVEDSIAEAYWYLAPPSEFYLEVGGLGPKRDAAFTSALQSKGFHAQIQTQDSEHSRILIGPFSTKSDLEQERRRLQSEGVLAVETPY
jgi:hypothetical protein